MMRAQYPVIQATRLPRTEEVNGEPITLRLMTPADATALHSFFSGAGRRERV